MFVKKYKMYNNTTDSGLISEILEDIFGKPKNHSRGKGQISFNCPMCDNGRNKGNLEVNYHMNVYKCWSCRDVNQMYGSLYKLIESYGTPNDLDTYTLLRGTSYSNFNYDGVKSNELDIPISFDKVYGNDSKESNNVKSYLYSRGLTDYHINKFDIRFSVTSGFKGRFFVPSFDLGNKMTYYVGRAIYDIMTNKYKNPDKDKDEVIMFEHLLDLNSDIFLVEGVMDAIVIPNSIPLLGKYITPKLLNHLRKKAKANIVIFLDGDAWDDAVNLYDSLNILELENRIRIIKVVGEWDASKIYQDFGIKGLYKILKTQKKLK